MRSIHALENQGLVIDAFQNIDKDTEAKITIRFADLGWPVFSPLISWVTDHWSNHCDVVLTDCLVSALPFSGVQRREPGVPAAVREEVITIPCTLEQRGRIAFFLVDRLGQPYDYLGVLGFAGRPASNDRQRWFCSELVATALKHAGIIDPGEPHLVSPGDLYRLLKPLAVLITDTLCLD